MTLAIAFATPGCVWMVADRRYGPPIKPNFLGCKLCQLETRDSRGVLSYAGIGAKAHPKPFELSEWIKRTVCGIDAPLDTVLEHMVSEAIRRSMDRMMGSHTFLYAGFHGDRPLIEIITNEKRLSLKYPRNPTEQKVLRLGDMAFNRQRIYVDSGGRATMKIGSGARFVGDRVTQGTGRYLGDPTKFVAVEAKIAKAIVEASRSDPGVSPESIAISVRADKTICAREYDKEGIGGPITKSIPLVSNGLLLGEVLEAISPVIFPALNEALVTGTDPVIDEAALNDRVKNIRDEPDSSF